MKGNTLQFYNRLTGGFVRLHPDGTVDAIGEKTDKYGTHLAKQVVLLQFWELEEGRSRPSLICSIVSSFHMTLH